MTEQKTPPLSAENRYLNLAGAPWSPQNPNRIVTPVMMYAGAASAAIISLTACFIDSSNPLVNLSAGGLGGGLVIAGVCRGRRREAQFLSPHHALLVIDKQPDPHTITSPDILSRVIGRAAGYTNGDLGTKTLGVMGAAAFAAQTIPALNEGYAASAECLIGATASIFSAVEMERRRQFERIASGEWVITDSGNAVSHFQNEDRKKLLSQQGYAMAPVPVRPPRDRSINYE